jgi:hypothetical protein
VRHWQPECADAELVIRKLVTVILLCALFHPDAVQASTQGDRDAVRAHLYVSAENRTAYARAQAKLADARAQITAIDEALDPLSGYKEAYEDDSRALALSLYATGRADLDLGFLLQSDDPMGWVSRRTLLAPLGVTRQTDNQTYVNRIIPLKQSRIELAKQVAELAPLVDTLRTRMSSDTATLDKLAKKVVKERGDVSVLGTPRLTAKQIADYAERKSAPWVLSVSREQLAQWYIEEGIAEGVRGDIAFSQATLESGWFLFRGSMLDKTQNNFAGIGACDSCSDGESFDSVHNGVRAHIQMIRTYADPDYSSKKTAHPPVGRIDTNVVKGCCLTWGELGKRWASAPGYGLRVVRMYNDMASEYDN